MKSILNRFTIICVCFMANLIAHGQTGLNGEAIVGTNFQFTINGSSGTVEVLASTDLITWTSLGSVTLVGGTNAYTDTTASSFTNRFYCAKQSGICSSNTIGFVKMVVPTKGTNGVWQFIAFANQLNNPAGNSLEVLFPDFVKQSQVLTWIMTEGYLSFQKSGTPAYWGSSTNLDPSWGAAMVHAGGTNPVTVILVGEVPHGPQIITNFPTVVGNLSLMSSVIPRAGTLDDMVFPAMNGDEIQQFIGQQWVTTATRTNGYWSPSPPFVQIGESFFLKSGSSSNRMWVEDFSTQPCAQEQPWSFIQIEDLHAGSVLNTNAFKNTIDTIITSNNAWNMRFVLTAGDLYESATNFSPSVLPNILDMTNQMWRCKTNGIPWVNIPGNHDADTIFSGDTNILYWNQIFGDSFYAGDTNVYKFTNWVAGSTRDCAWRMTNGSMKLLIIGLAWNENTNNPECSGYGYVTPSNTVYTYTPATTWASNLCRQFPDHHVIAAMHYFMDTNGVPNTKDLPPDDDVCPTGIHQSYVNEGPGLAAWLSLKSATNISMFLSGHVRRSPMVKSRLTCDDGHTAESIKFNTQYASIIDGTNTINNGGCFVLYTVYPSEHYARGRVFDSDMGRFLTNGEFSSSGFVNDWTFPFKKLP